MARTDVSKINFSQSRLYSNVSHVSQIDDKMIQNIYKKSQHYKNKLADSQYVNILNQRLYTIENETSVRCTLTNAVKILNDEGKSESTQYFTYLKDRQNAKLVYAITIQPDGKVFAVDESAVNDEPLNNSYPLYDTQHRVKFGHKNANVGSLLIWQAEFEITVDPIFSPFYAVLSFMDSEPVLDYDVRITHPADMLIDYEIYQGYFPKVKPHIKKTKNEIAVSVRNIPPYRIDEEETPSHDILLPKVFIGRHIIGTGTPDQIVSLSYSQEYFKNEPSDEILAFADKILSANKAAAPLTPLETADLLYYYVNRNIQTAAVSLSVTGAVPHEDSILCSSSYLNVLDKTYLFTRMMQSQGIGDARMKFYCSADAVFPKNVSSIRRFNHIICEADIDGEKHFYSFNGKNYSRDVRPIGSDNAPCLDVTHIGECESLPPIDAESNRYEFDLSCILRDDCSLRIEQNIGISGIGMQSWRELRYLSKAQMSTYMNKRALSFGKDVAVKDYKFESDIADYSIPVRFAETYDVQNFAYRSGDNILLSVTSLGLNLSAGSVSKPNRLYPYDTSDISVVKKNISIALPDGYKVKSV
ncbi:MAG: DUF3857 domain-containing protein, partial [Spirochaetales bacterium]|nr:DUF3857 domain-containing protein [Spirochaetales bacterium]